MLWFWKKWDHVSIFSIIVDWNRCSGSPFKKSESLQGISFFLVFINENSCRVWPWGWMHQHTFIFLLKEKSSDGELRFTYPEGVHSILNSLGMYFLPYVYLTPVLRGCLLPPEARSETQLPFLSQVSQAIRLLQIFITLCCATWLVWCIPEEAVQMVFKGIFPWYSYYLP